MPFKDDDERRVYIREYDKGWYQRNRERRLQKRKQHSEELKQWLRRYKSKLCCSECGENHPACLQFHHRDKEAKSFTISEFLGGTYVSLARLEKEIAKCDVLCGNCHAILHWRETHDSDDWSDVLPQME